MKEYLRVGINCTHPKFTNRNGLENNKLVTIHKGQDHNITKVGSLFLQHCIDFLPCILQDLIKRNKYNERKDSYNSLSQQAWTSHSTYPDILCSNLITLKALCYIIQFFFF